MRITVMRSLIMLWKSQNRTVHAPMQWFRCYFKEHFAFRISLVQNSKISFDRNQMQMVWDSCVSRRKRAALDQFILIKKLLMQCLNIKDQSMQKMMKLCLSHVMVLIQLMIMLDGFVDSFRVMIWMFRVMTFVQVKLQDILQNAKTYYKPANSSVIALSKPQKSIWSLTKKQCLQNSNCIWSSRQIQESKDRIWLRLIDVSKIFYLNIFYKVKFYYIF